MMNAEQRRAFVRQHRTCIFGYQRRQGPPSMSVVYYKVHGDEIVISTMAERAKAKAVQRLGEVSLCVLDEQWPLTYRQVSGSARIDTDFDRVVDLMLEVGELMSGQKIPPAALPIAEGMARKEKRVVIRFTPERTVYTPPQHLRAGDDGSELVHGLAQRMPWRE